jgi:hypothetical protein
LTTIIFDKINFMIKKVTRYRREHYMLMKISIHQEDIAIQFYMHENNKIVNYIKQNQK